MRFTFAAFGIIQTFVGIDAIRSCRIEFVTSRAYTTETTQSVNTSAWFRAEIVVVALVYI